MITYSQIKMIDLLTQEVKNPLCRRSEIKLIIFMALQDERYPK